MGFIFLSEATLDISISDVKFWYMIFAFIFGIISFVVYFISTIKDESNPHPVSWFVWFLTQSMGAVSAYQNGGGYGLAYSIFYCFTVLTILIYTLYRHGIVNVSKDEIVGLVACIIAIIIWIYYDTPLIGVITAIAVDGYGFFVTIRKSFEKPWEESLWGWGLSIPNLILTAMAMTNFEFLSVGYSLTNAVFAIILVTVLIYKRR